MTDKKVTIKSKDLDGKVVNVVAKRPDGTQLKNAQRRTTKTFNEAIVDGAVLRAKLNDHMRKQGLWSDEKEQELKALIDDLHKMELKLAGGGIKLSEAKELALSMSTNRAEQNNMLSEQRDLDSYTAEGQAENMKFDYLVSVCVLDAKTGNRMFNDLDDYYSKSYQPWAVEGASKLSEMLYGYDPRFRHNLPENQFLTKYNFVNDDLRLINEDGHLISEDGHLVDEFGRLINEDGHLCTLDGQLIDEDGNYIVDTKPFLDDNDKPIVDKVPKSKPKKSTK